MRACVKACVKGHINSYLTKYRFIFELFIRVAYNISNIAAHVFSTSERQVNGASSLIRLAYLERGSDDNNSQNIRNASRKPLKCCQGL
jgi:hypothetical protein